MIEKTLCRLGAIAILVTGAVHLELWLWHGYRNIHVIGPLFLLNAVTAAALAVLLVVRGGLLIALAGLGYAASTLAAFLLSVYHGLFGFVDTPHGTPQTVAAVAEVAAIVLLGAAVAGSLIRPGSRERDPGRRPLPHVPGVTERETAGLGPDAEAVRALADRDLR